MHTIPIPFKDKILHDTVKGSDEQSHFLGYVGAGEGFVRNTFRF